MRLTLGLVAEPLLECPSIGPTTGSALRRQGFVATAEAGQPRGTTTSRDGSNVFRPRSSAGLTVMGSSTASTKSR